ISVSFYTLVAAELAGAFGGLAYRLEVTQQNMQTGHKVAGPIILGLISTVADRLFRVFTANAVHWNTRDRNLPMELSTIGFDISKLQDGYARKIFTPEDVVREVYRRIDALGETYAWTELVSREAALAAARRLQARYEGQALPPLYGIPFSVKDNIDVAGLRTTCGCEGFDRLPEVSATSVQKALA